MRLRDMARLYTLLGLRWRTYTYANAPLLTELLERVRERAMLLSVLDHNVVLGTSAVTVFEVMISEIRAYAFGYQLWLLRQFRVVAAADVLRVEPRELEDWCAAKSAFASATARSTTSTTSRCTRATWTATRPFSTSSARAARSSG
jgi:hypothetical protein